MFVLFVSFIYVNSLFFVNQFRFVLSFFSSDGTFLGGLYKDMSKVNGY